MFNFCLKLLKGNSDHLSQSPVVSCEEVAFDYKFIFNTFRQNHKQRILEVCGSECAIHFNSRYFTEKRCTNDALFTPAQLKGIHTDKASVASNWNPSESDEVEEKGDSMGEENQHKQTEKLGQSVK